MPVRGAQQLPLLLLERRRKGGERKRAAQAVAVVVVVAATVGNSQEPTSHGSGHMITKPGTNLMW